MFSEAIQDIYNWIVAWVQSWIQYFPGQQIPIQAGNLPHDEQPHGDNLLVVTDATLKNSNDTTPAPEISTLPLEMLESITKHLDYKSLLSLATTSKRFFYMLTAPMTQRVSERFLIMAKTHIDILQSNLINLLSLCEDRYDGTADKLEKLIEGLDLNTVIDCSTSPAYSTDARAIFMTVKSTGVVLTHFPSTIEQDLKFLVCLAGKVITSCAYTTDNFIIASENDITILRSNGSSISANCYEVPRYIRSTATEHKITDRPIRMIRRLCCGLIDQKIFLVFQNKSTTLNDVVAFYIADDKPIVLPVKFYCDIEIDSDSLIILSYTEKSGDTDQFITCYCTRSKKILPFSVDSDRTQLIDAQINIYLRKPKSLTEMIGYHDTNMTPTRPPNKYKFSHLHKCQMLLDQEHCRLLSNDSNLKPIHYENVEIFSTFRRGIAKQLQNERKHSLAVSSLAPSVR